MIALPFGPIVASCFNPPKRVPSPAARTTSEGTVHRPTRRLRRRATRRGSMPARRFRHTLRAVKVTRGVAVGITAAFLAVVVMFGVLLSRRDPPHDPTVVAATAEE